MPVTVPNRAPVRPPTVFDGPLESGLRKLAAILGLTEPPTEADIVADAGGMMGPLGMAAVPARRLVQQMLPHMRGFGMGEADRLIRAKRMGFNVPVYHGTLARHIPSLDDPAIKARMQAGENVPAAEAAPAALRRLQPGGSGLKMMDGMGIHTGTPEAATQRIEQVAGRKFGTPRRPVDPKELTDANVLPLMGRAQTPFTKRGGEPYTESELQRRLGAIAKQLGFSSSDVRRASRWSSAGRLSKAQRAVKKELQGRGFDSIPYVNSHEDRGSVSWIFFEPNQLRSRFARFDPSKSEGDDLLAGIAALAAGVGAFQEREHQP